MPQLTVYAALEQLMDILMAHGPDTPLWVRTGPEPGDAPPTLAPCTGLRVTRTAGTPAVLVVGAGAEPGTPHNPVPLPLGEGSSVAEVPAWNRT